MDLCATSVSSVSLWLLTPQRHREHREETQTRRCGIAITPNYMLLQECGQTASKTRRVRRVSVFLLRELPLIPGRRRHYSRVKLKNYIPNELFSVNRGELHHSITFDMSSSNVEHMNLALFDSE